jgi:hypothetical protein
MGTKRTSNNNISGSVRGGVNNTAGVINERFRCKDLSGSWVSYYAPLTVKLEPKVVKFGWSPSTVDVGVEISFEWQIDNVKNCTSMASGLKASSGSIGPMKFYRDSSTSLTSSTYWYCEDLDGNRYPTEGFLEGVRTVQNLTNKQHIDISFTNSNSGSALSTNDKLIANATPLVVDGNMTDILSVSFRYLKVGTLDILDTVAAVENNNTFTSTFESDLVGGNYVLQVVVDGISQSGLTKYFTVKAKPNVVKFGWFPSTIDVSVKMSFEWQIDNVKNCTSIASGPKASSGTIGPMKFYRDSATSSTNSTYWYCEDLGGNRYPAEGFLEGVRTVTNLANKQHFDISFTNSDTGGVFTTASKLIVKATPLMVDGNMTDISSVSFRYLKVGTLDILDTVAAVENNNTFTSTFESDLVAGNYVLQQQLSI